MTAAPDAGKPVLIVAGPTCSGKSLLAMILAERLGGTIINADSMQIYRELRIVTARPSTADEARIPHTLYGVRPAAEAGSAAWWRQAALDTIGAAHAAGRLPILCGGTGLYLSALTQGLADIPEPGLAARQEARALLAELGPEGLHARLMRVDLRTAAGLRPGDSQRVARAWEVWRGTGRGMAAWHAEQARAGPVLDLRAILIDPPREDLRAAIAGRFASMVAAGAIEEVEALLSQRLDPALPAMRAHGVPELAAYLRGEMSLAQAEAKACLVTAQYTKRQATWFRHRALVPPHRLRKLVARITHLEQFSCSWMADMQNFILSPIDAVQHGPYDARQEGDQDDQPPDP
jgi:tRNA dimethylallyltransferase